MFVTHSPRRLITVLISSAATLALVACGAATTPSESSSPQASIPTAAPSATAPPVDIAEVFAEKMAGSVAFFSELGGNLRVGELEGEISGHMWAVAGDRDTLTVITFPGLPPQETQVITVNDTTYSRNAQGPWLLQPTTEGSADAGNALSTALANVDDLEVVGPETVDGEVLQRLAARNPTRIDPVAFGLTDPTVTDFDGELAFLAQEDGTPAGMILTASWLQGPPDAQVPAELEMRFIVVDETAEIAAPSDPWTVYEGSAFGYRVAYPADWDVTHEPATDEFSEFDYFLGPVDGEIEVYRYGPDDIGGTTANEWFRGTSQIITETFGVEPQLTATISLDGLEGQVFGLTYTDQGEEYTYQVAMIFGGDVAWELDWYSLAGNEEADNALFLQVVNSFERAEG